MAKGSAVRLLWITRWLTIPVVGAAAWRCLLTTFLTTLAVWQWAPAAHAAQGTEEGAAPAVAQVMAADPFSDIPGDHWAHDEILACLQAGLVDGYPDGRYYPDQPVSRDQMAVFIARAIAGGDQNVPAGPAQAPFVDVPADHWAARYVEFVKQNAIATGYLDGCFHPDDLVNRGQMAAFIARSVVQPMGDAGMAGQAASDTPRFADVTPTNEWGWCYDYVDYIASMEIATGYPDGLYHADLNCTRAEMAVFLARAFDLPVPRHFDTVPTSLAAVAGVHPRLYLSQARVTTLTSMLQTEPYAALWEDVRRVADYGVSHDPPDYWVSDDPNRDEQLWQRQVGDMIPHLAIAYVLSGERGYLDAAERWMLASAQYPTWGLGDTDGLDLAAGHQLYGLAIGYDWLYRDLDSGTRDVVRNCLYTRGQYMYTHLLNEQVWWHDAYLQNHQWANLTGLATAGLALWGDVDGVDDWILLPLQKYRIVMASLGPDGASHEGVSYWSYGLEHMLKFIDLAKGLLDENLLEVSPWLQQTSSFRLYSMLPRMSWSADSDAMNFADGTRYDFSGPDYMLRKLAAEYRDGHAQWLADEVSAAHLTGWSARFLNLLWVDPTVPPVPPADLPLLRHFGDMDMVFDRSSWGGAEAVLGFKCGPYIGHQALSAYSYDPGGGHVHPDAASFLLFAYGDWLIVDDGNTLKTTAFQNTALVNGVGQEGDGLPFFEGDLLSAEHRGPQIVRVDPGVEYDYMVGDATPAYRSEAGLTRFFRHILYLKPACWVIVDELEADRPSLFELYLHADFAFRRSSGKSFTLRGPNGSLAISPLEPEDVRGETLQQQLVGKDGEPAGIIQALRLSNRDARARALFVTVLEAYPSGGRQQISPSIEESDQGETLVLEAPDRTWRFAIRPDRPDYSSPILVETGS